MCVARIARCERDMTRTQPLGVVLGWSVETRKERQRPAEAEGNPTRIPIPPTWETPGSGKWEIANANQIGDR